MAFPVIQTGNTQSGAVTSNSSLWTLTYPGSLVSGDLILALIATDGVLGAPTFPSGFVGQQYVSGANTLLLGKKVSDGTESGNFTLGLTAAEQGAWRIFRITGWDSALGISTVWGNPSASAVVDSGNTNGISNAPNPASLDPAGWGQEDTLWAAVISVDTSRTISAYPSGWNDLQVADVSGGAGGATLGTVWASSNTPSIDPSTFTISASDDWVATTIGIRPAAPAVPGHVFPPYVNKSQRAQLLRRA